MTKLLATSDQGTYYCGVSGSENSLPTLVKERSHLGTGYCKTPPLKNKKTFNGNQEGSMLDLEPFPDES